MSADPFQQKEQRPENLGRNTGEKGVDSAAALMAPAPNLVLLHPLRISGKIP